MKLTIYKKIILGFTLIIALMIIANAYVLVALDNVTESTRNTLTSDVHAVDLAKQLSSILVDEERFAQKHLISRDDTYFRLFTDLHNRFDTHIDSLLETEPDSLERAIIGELQEGHRWFVSSVTRESQVALPMSLEQRRIHDQSRADTLESLYIRLADIVSLNQQSINKAMANAGTTMMRSSNVAYLLTIGAFLGAITVALIIARTITKPIGVLIRGTDRIAHGRFDSIDVPSRDEIAMLASAINDMSNKLKHIDEMKTDLMHHISHELRTPLQTMLSAHYILSEQRQGPINEGQARLLETIRQGINKLTRFTNQFLDISKIEAGRMQYRFVHANLVDILNAVVEEARVFAEQKHVTITFTSSPLPEVRGDLEKLSHIFSNLLSNAIKYSSRGGKVEVVAELCRKGVRVSVRDFGIGIDADDLPKIFTKFFQARNAGKIDAKGTGVGLALVKALTEGHGGIVYVESKVNEGSTFTVELPAVNGTSTPMTVEANRKTG
ncbi:MAG: HAMP domain-containing protein [Ignavibacteriae bacterium]|nr:HAMP domain-containing protein [Ignavibacteriota bacterium]